MRRLRGGIRQWLTELCRPDGSIARTSEDVLAELQCFGVLQTATRDVDGRLPWTETSTGPIGRGAAEPLLDSQITDGLAVRYWPAPPERARERTA